MELEQVLWLSSGGGGGGGGGGFSTSQFQGSYAFDHGLQISEATNNCDIQIQQPIEIINLENDLDGEIVTNKGRFDHLTITRTESLYESIKASTTLEKNTECIDEANCSEAQAEVRKVSKKLKALNNNDLDGEIVTNKGRFDHLKITRTESFYESIKASTTLEKNTECIDEANCSEAQAEVRKVSKKLKALNNNDSNGETVTNKGCFDHLTRTKTNSHYDLMEPILRFETNTKCIDETNHSEAQAEVRKVSKKLKALNFRASLLKIGIWEEVAEQVEGLIVRCYFAKEQLVWEISRTQSLKKKIEINWSDILAIRAKIMEDGTGVLEIELNRPPSFYEESTPIPRKHTIWNINSDFTGGQALNYRRHYLEFPPGVLEKYHKKLLESNELLKLSQNPFPSLSSPYFNCNFSGATMPQVHEAYQPAKRKRASSSSTNHMYNGEQGMDMDNHDYFSSSSMHSQSRSWQPPHQVSHGNLMMHRPQGGGNNSL